MTIITGDLWDELGAADLILFSANATIGKQGLIMGAGAAKEAADRFPDLPFLLAKRVLRDYPTHKGKYGCVSVMTTWQGQPQRIGAFQTKILWRHDSTLELIEFSTEKLVRYADNFAAHRIAVNFPGVGKGGLNEADVLPIIEKLPGNVFVYRRANFSL